MHLYCIYQLNKGNNMKHQLVTINQEVAMNTPSTIVFTVGNFEVTKSLIPLNNDTSKVVYFVDSLEGHSYDSFASQDDATEYAEKLAA